MAEGTYFFTSISSVSIVELPSGGWTLFYDQDIARSPHLPVIITITKAIITAMIVKINPCFCPNLALVLDKKLVDPRLPSPVYACIESLLTTKTAIRNNTMINTIYMWLTMPAENCTGKISIQHRQTERLLPDPIQE